MEVGLEVGVGVGVGLRVRVGVVVGVGGGEDYFLRLHTPFSIVGLAI